MSNRIDQRLDEKFGSMTLELMDVKADVAMSKKANNQQLKREC